MELEVKYSGNTINFKKEIVSVNGNTVMVSAFTINDQTLGFSEKCTINFYYQMEDKLFIWENVTVKLIKYNNKPYHRIELSGEGELFHHRGAYRLYIGEEMPMSINTPTGISTLTVLVKDISETGVGFVTEEEIDLSLVVHFKIQDGISNISLYGFVIRKEFQENIHSYIYGCKLHDINMQLSKYIAKRQNELLRMKNNPPSTVKRDNPRASIR
jgi:hypothetical protein